MHTLESTAPHRFGPVSQLPASAYEPSVTFAPSQTTPPSETHIGRLVAERTARGQFFYGIEISALNRGQPTRLDFNRFLPVLPAFVSLVWLGHDYWSVQPIEQVPTLALARHLAPHIPVMPHVSAYRMSAQRLDEFLSLNLSNVLTVRGDKVHEEQPFDQAWQLVERARSARSDTISIGVAGYPEGYMNPDAGPQNASLNIQHLKKKLAAGADFLITQFCYQPELIVQFIRDCRAAGISAPIMVGVTVPDSWRSYQILERITGVRLPPEQRTQVEQLKQSELVEFFVQLALTSIERVLDAQLEVHGVQFFTMNRFKPVLAVLEQLRARGILKEQS